MIVEYTSEPNCIDPKWCECLLAARKLFEKELPITMDVISVDMGIYKCPKCGQTLTPAELDDFYIDSKGDYIGE